MSIYEKAMQLELEGKEMYMSMLANTTDVGLQGVLRTLAGFEQNHYDVFKSLSEKSAKVDVKELSLPSIKTIAENLKKNTSEEDLDAVVAAYKQALALEEENEKIYLDMAEETESEEERAQFISIAKEETKHKAVIKSIIDCIEGGIHTIDSAEF